MNTVRMRVTLLTIAVCWIFLPPTVRTQESPIEIDVQVSPSAYPLSVPVSIEANVCNPTANPVTVTDSCGGSCLIDIFIENEAGEDVAQMGRGGPAFLHDVTWEPFECFAYEGLWRQREGFFGSGSGPQAPAGVYRARVEFYGYPPPSPAFQRSAPFRIGVPFTEVPTLSTAGLTGLLLALAGAAFAVLRRQRRDPPPTCD